MRFIVKLYFVLSSQFGIDPRRMLRSFQGVPRYLRDLFLFRKSYTGRLDLTPCLHDWHEEGGGVKDEYFWQDLLVARMISKANPEKHVDIGSRVDGFVSHVASFREIEVFDIRPISTKIPGVIFRQADLMSPVSDMAGYCDSLSCLHALEHFGLGRYGDKIDPNGFVRGFGNMVRLLKDGGIFYLSVPVGIERVEFNANRVFDPRVVVKMAIDNSLQLVGVTILRQGGKIEEFAPAEMDFLGLATQRYSLGVFVFRKGRHED